MAKADTTVPATPAATDKAPKKQKKPRDIGRFNGLLRRRWNLAFRQFLRPNRLRRTAATVRLPRMTIVGGGESPSPPAHPKTLRLLPWANPLKRDPFVGIGFLQHFQDTGGFLPNHDHFGHIQNFFLRIIMSINGGHHHM